MVRKKESGKREKDQFTVVLEDINSKFDFLVEGQQMLKEEFNSKFDRLSKEQQHLKTDFQGLKENFQGLKEDFHDLKEDFQGLKDSQKELKKGLDLSLKYLYNIEEELHGELRTKVDAKEFAVFQKKVLRLEDQVAALTKNKKAAKK